MLKALKLLNKLEQQNIRRAVRELKEQQHHVNDISVPALREIMERDQSKKGKIFWIVVLIVCLAFITYQVFDRVSFYLSYPVVIDVENVIEDQMDLPQAMICSGDTPKMAVFWQNFVYGDKALFERYGDYRCLNMFLGLLREKRLDIDTLYEATNMSAVFDGIYITKANPKVDIKIAVKDVNFSFGICNLFKLDRPATHHERSSATVKLCRPHKMGCMTSAITVSLIKFEEYPNLKQSFLQSLGTISKTWFSISKFEFVNSPKNPCVDDKTYIKCFRDCIIKRLQANLTCRFRFTPIEVKKPKCATGDEAYRNYVTSYSDYEDSDPIADCQCPRQCKLVNYQQTSEGMTPESKPGEEVMTQCHHESKDECCTEIGLEFKGNNVISHKERLLYDGIALLSDIGGNLGLSLNLSLLSIIQLMLTSWKLATIEKKSYSFLNRTRNASTKKFKIIYDTIIAESKTSEAKLITDGRVNVKQLLQFLIFGVVSVTSAYVVFQNASYYWFEPVTTIIEVTLPNTLRFPDVTVCGEKNLRVKRMNVAKVLAKSSSTRIDSCSLSPWELIDRNVKAKMTVEEIWSKLTLINSFYPKLHQNQTDISKLLSGKNYWPKLNATHIPLPYGNCTRFTARESKFQGTISVHHVGLKPEPELLADKLCSKQYIKYLLTPPNEPLELSSVTSIPVYMKTLLWVLIKKMVRLNTYTNPCVSTEDFFRCKYDCFAKKFAKVMRRLNCRLPFITNSSLPYCQTSDDAAQVNDAYMKIYLKTYPPNHCKCVRRCNETIYDVHLFTSPHSVAQFTLINLIFYTNLIESFVEIKAYPLPKLLSDIGSCLGLLLGFNLLSPFSLIRTVKLHLSKKFISQITNKPTRNKQ